MPLVFVHGINTRQNLIYESRVAKRNDLFKNRSFIEYMPGLTDDRIFNPYWGDYGAPPDYELAAFPQPNAERFGDFGDSDDLLESLIEDIPTQSTRETYTVKLAKSGKFVDAVDVLTTAALVGSGPREDQPPKLLMLQRFAEAAFAYAIENNQPQWLKSVKDDSEFVDRLIYAIGQSRTAGKLERETFGEEVSLGNLFKSAADRLGSAAMSIREQGARLSSALAARVDRVATAPADLQRAIAHRWVSRFMGDIFTYLARRSDPNPTIFRPVLDDLDKAREAGQAKPEPLVVIGHSLGGVILYDLLASGRAANVDLLLTIGSQVGIFSALGIFREEDRAGSSATGKTPTKPETVSRWINVYNARDVLSFSVAKLFTGVEDYTFQLEGLTPDYHGAYLFSQRFHARLQDRLKRSAP